MAIIHQKDKRSGITYAYEAVYCWDKEKKQSRSTRTLIGRVDEQTGEIIPTDGRNRKKQSSSTTQQRKKQHGKVAATQQRHQYFGATYLLDCIAKQTGVWEDLKAVFPQNYEQLLSIAYYLILESNNPLYRFEKRNHTHRHPYGADISSPRSSELFSAIRNQDITAFCKAQGVRRMEKEYLAYDITSISSYSECLKQIQYGYNKENDKLPQLNLLLLFGEESGLPFYYRKLAGNIPDVKTVKGLLADLDILGLGKIKLVMDRGFYSVENINGLMKEHLKFLVGVRLSLKLVKEELRKVHDSMRDFRNFNQELNTYGITVPTEWDYSVERPYKGNIISEKRRVYVQIFYDLDRSAEDERAFDQKIATLYNELVMGQRIESHEKQYQKYFMVKQTPKRGIQVTVKEEELTKARYNFGYFSLLTNEKMDAFTALNIYRMKDIVEKAFGNIKERLNMRRLLVSSERNLDGKLFVEFLALILVSSIHKRLQNSGTYKKYTMQQVLDRLDVIECFEMPGHDLRIGEVLSEQHELFNRLEVPSPTSL